MGNHQHALPETITRSRSQRIDTKNLHNSEFILNNTLEYSPGSRELGRPTCTLRSTEISPTSPLANAWQHPSGPEHSAMACHKQGVEPLRLLEHQFLARPSPDSEQAHQ